MLFDKSDMINQLKIEIAMLERGGYQPSVHEPRRESHIFRDSVSCLNVDLEKKVYPCSSCFLIEFVPPELKNSNDDPCHKIPLNEKGDTVESLEREGEPDKLRAAVLGWLKATVAKLGKEVASVWKTDLCQRTCAPPTLALGLCSPVCRF
jgi:hypothetical protein